MPRKKDEHQLQKVTLNLVHGDYARIGALYPELSAGTAIRLIIHAHLRKLNKTPVTESVSQSELDKII